MKVCGSFLKKASLSPEAIKAGKSQLKVQVLSEADAGTSLAESLAAQGFYTGSVKSPADIAKDIDALSANDIQQVSLLKRILSRKF